MKKIACLIVCTVLLHACGSDHHQSGGQGNTGNNGGTGNTGNGGGTGTTGNGGGTGTTGNGGGTGTTGNGGGTGTTGNGGGTGTTGNGDTVTIRLAPTVSIQDCQDGSVTFTVLRNDVVQSHQATAACAASTSTEISITADGVAHAGDRITLRTANHAEVAKGVLVATDTAHSFTAGLSNHTTRLAHVFTAIQPTGATAVAACVSHYVALLARFTSDPSDLSNAASTIANTISSRCQGSDNAARSWVSTPEVMLSQATYAHMNDSEWTEDVTAYAYHRALYVAHPLRDDPGIWTDIGNSLRILSNGSEAKAASVMGQQALLFARYLSDTSRINAALEGVDKEQIDALIAQWVTSWDGDVGYLHGFVPFSSADLYAKFVSRFEMTATYNDSNVLTGGTVHDLFYSALEAATPGTQNAAIALRLGQKILNTASVATSANPSSATTTFRRGLDRNGFPRNYTLREAIGLVAVAAAFQEFNRDNAYAYKGKSRWHMLYNQGWNTQTSQMIERRAYWTAFLGNKEPTLPAAFSNPNPADHSNSDYWATQTFGTNGSTTELLNWLSYMKADLDVILLNNNSTRVDDALMRALLIDETSVQSSDLTTYIFGTLDANDNPNTTTLLQTAYDALGISARLHAGLQLLAIDDGGIPH